MGAPIYQMGNMGSSVNSEETAKPGTIEAANKKSDKDPLTWETQLLLPYK